MDEFIGRLNYYIYIAMMMVGLYGMIGKKNLVKKVIGMNIFQWSIILFFVSIGAKRGAGIPILEGGHGDHAAHHAAHAIDYVNPLPHVLMLTAIVVGVGTTGVALALLIKMYKKYQTTDEDELLRKMR
jgi:multicomponent Na+:H+ antiporter subunit C